MNDVSKIKAWQYYWSQKGLTVGSKTNETEALPLGGFWTALHPQVSNATRILELGCGDKTLFPKTQISNHRVHVALDVSLSALQNIKSGIYRICATGSKSLPIRAGSIDLIISQFGIEYFGLNALKDLTHYLRPSGAIALICHHRGSVIYKNYFNHRMALATLDQQSFWELLTKKLNSQNYNLSNEIGCLELILNKFGETSCGGLIALVKGQLLQLESTSDSKILIEKWLTDVRLAVQSYADLIESMIASALTKSQLDEIESLWKKRGFQVNVTAIRAGAESIATSITAARAS